jgi:hypothetical protein
MGFMKYRRTQRREHDIIRVRGANFIGEAEKRKETA